MSLIFSFVFLWEKGREALRCWLWESGKISWRVGLRVSPYLETLYPVSSSVFLCFSVCLPPPPPFLFVCKELAVCVYVYLSIFVLMTVSLCVWERTRQSFPIFVLLCVCLFVHSSYCILLVNLWILPAGKGEVRGDRWVYFFDSLSLWQFKCPYELSSL